MKASNDSWEKQASRRTVRRRLWFMALFTSELEADSLSASSAGGAPGACFVLTSASGPGVGAWLVEARLATSPDVVRRGLFVLKIARTLICPDRITPGKQRVRRHLSPDYIPFCPTGPCGPSLASRRRFGLPPWKSPLQNTVVIRNTGIRENGISLKGMRLRFLSPGRPGLTLGNQP